MRLSGSTTGPPLAQRSRSIPNRVRSTCLHREKLASPSRHIFFRGSARDQFIEQGRTLLGAQNTAQSLNIFAFCAVATHNDCHTTVWHIDTFVEDSARDQLGVLARSETFENSTSLLGMCFVGDAWDTKATTDFIDNIVVF